jgi:hypothetical protein
MVTLQVPGSPFAWESRGADAPKAAKAGVEARSSPSRKSSLPSPSESAATARPETAGRPAVRSPRAWAVLW